MGNKTSNNRTSNTVELSLIQKNKCVNLINLIAIEKIINNYTFELNVKWIKFTQSKPIAQNYGISTYTDNHGNRNREPLQIIKIYDYFYKSKKCIYEQLKVENVIEDALLYLQDDAFKLYHEIKQEI